MFIMFILFIMFRFVDVSAVLNERFPPIDNHLHRRLHHRIHHGHHLYSDLGFTDSESVLQVCTLLFWEEGEKEA